MTGRDIPAPAPTAAVESHPTDLLPVHPAADMFPVDAFDYSALTLEIASNLREQAARIKARIRKSTADIIEIGRDLLAAKQHLVDHGQFIKWIESEVGIAKRTAQAYMAAARLYDKSATVALLPPATVYRLAAKSTPEAVVDAVTAKAEAGEIVPDIAVAQMIADAKFQQRAKSSKNTAAAVRHDLVVRGQIDRVEVRADTKGGKQSAKKSKSKGPRSSQQKYKEAVAKSHFLFRAEDACKLAIFEGTKVDKDILGAAEHVVQVWFDLRERIGTGHRRRARQIAVAAAAATLMKELSREQFDLVCELFSNNNPFVLTAALKTALAATRPDDAQAPGATA